MRDLGQNFLKEESFLEEIAQALPKGRKVLEIGAGHGELTKFLAKRASKVLAIEVDDRLIPDLKKAIGKSRKVKLVHGDALQFPFKGFKYFAGNIPYYISSPLVFKILESPFSQAVLLLQKEFAQRLVAVPGTDDWSRLAVMAQNAADIKIIDEVPKECFEPAPSVDSAVVLFKARPKAKRLKIDTQIVALLFQHKNQTLKNALVHSRRALGLEKDAARAAAAKLGFPEKKVRELTPQEFEAVSKHFYSRKTHRNT